MKRNILIFLLLGFIIVVILCIVCSPKDEHFESDTKIVLPMCNNNTPNTPDIPNTPDNSKPSNVPQSLYKRFGKSKANIKSYLDYILEDWPKGQDGSGNVLYKTYINGSARMDVYDNSLLANILIIVNESNTPPDAVVKVLNTFQAGYDYLQSSQNTQNNKLLSAAYSQQGSQLLPMSWDTEAVAQDVGNNSLVGIALGKFCIKYPSHPNVQSYKKSLHYLTNVYLNDMKCPNNRGFYRRWPINNMNISMEHMIDVYAMGIIFQILGIQRASELISIAKGFVSDPTFFINNKYYGVGTTNGCTIENNFGAGNPFDTQTWNMLSGADNNISKKDLSLKWVIDTGYNSDTPGISFALPRNNMKGCSQYENTGSLLAALNEYRYVFGKDLTLSSDQRNKIDSIYEFIKNKIDKNEKIFSAYSEGNVSGYSGCEQANFPGCCSYIGGGWKYPLAPHLGSTVYSALALLSVLTPANVYKHYD